MGSNGNGNNGNGTKLATKGVAAIDTMRAYLGNARAALEQVATKHLTPERLIRAVLAAISRTPQLLEATPHSILQCVMIAAQLGLEPNTPLGHFYLVPFLNKKVGKYEATPIIGYRGLVELARRSGKIVSVEAHVVHEKDPHEVRFGMDAKLWHSPCLDGDSGAPLYVYAIATMEGGAKQAEVMTWAEVMKIKDRSRASSNGPWVTDPEEMGKKTVFRRLAKWLPLTVEAAEALAAEDDPESLPALPPAIAIELPPAEPAKSTRTEAVKEAVKKAAKGQEVEHEPGMSARDRREAAEEEAARRIASGEKGVIVVDASEESPVPTDDDAPSTFEPPAGA